VEAPPLNADLIKTGFSFSQSSYIYKSFYRYLICITDADSDHAISSDADSDPSISTDADFDYTDANSDHMVELGEGGTFQYH